MPDLFDNNNFDLNTLFKEKEMNEDVKNRVISIQNKYLNLQKEIDKKWAYLEMMEKITNEN